MAFIKTAFEGLLIFEPDVYHDNRGHFFESYNGEVFGEAGINMSFVQDNQSSSLFGVIRGLHYQLHPYAQSKLVRVLTGKILDVVLDIRYNSPTYGKHLSLELSDANFRQLFIPKGFAHGFSVLSEKAVVMYKCDVYYNKESETGILFNDPALNIDWQIPPEKQIISEKDLKNPLFGDHKGNF